MTICDWVRKKGGRPRPTKELALATKKILGMLLCFGVQNVQVFQKFCLRSSTMQTSLKSIRPSNHVASCFLNLGGSLFVPRKGSVPVVQIHVAFHTIEFAFEFTSVHIWVLRGPYTIDRDGLASLANFLAIAP